MQLLSTIIKFLLFTSFAVWLNACGGGGGGNGNGSTLEFFNNFEGTNVTKVATFDLSENGITATVAGGTVFTIGNGLLYHSGSKSWMVEPAGVNIRGTHTGTGTITFNVPMSQISFWVRSDPGNISMVTIIDVDGNHAENSPITTVVSAAWTEVDWTITIGSPPLKSILLEVTGGVGMAALDDLGGNSE